MAIIGYKGEELDILIRQGATFGPYVLTLTNPDNSPVNLTGCEVRGQIRKVHTDALATASFNCEVTNPTSGIFTMQIPAEVTANIDCSNSETDSESLYVWDIELVDSASKVLPLIYGNVQVFREITK